MVEFGSLRRPVDFAARPRGSFYLPLSALSALSWIRYAPIELTPSCTTSVPIHPMGEGKEPTSRTVPSPYLSRMELTSTRRVFFTAEAEYAEGRGEKRQDLSVALSLNHRIEEFVDDLIHESCQPPLGIV